MKHDGGYLTKMFISFTEVHAGTREQADYRRTQ